MLGEWSPWGALLLTPEEGLPWVSDACSDQATAEWSSKTVSSLHGASEAASCRRLHLSSLS